MPFLEWDDGGKKAYAVVWLGGEYSKEQLAKAEAQASSGCLSYYAERVYAWAGDTSTDEGAVLKAHAGKVQTVFDSYAAPITLQLHRRCTAMVTRPLWNRRRSQLAVAGVDRHPVHSGWLKFSSSQMNANLIIFLLHSMKIGISSGRAPCRPLPCPEPSLQA